MSDIVKYTEIKIKPGVYWKGKHIGNFIGVVIDSDSYVLAEVNGFEEPVKLFRHEFTKINRNYAYDLTDYGD
jgi:hypothetical protein